MTFLQDTNIVMTELAFQTRTTLFFVIVMAIMLSLIKNPYAHPGLIISQGLWGLVKAINFAVTLVPFYTFLNKRVSYQIYALYAVILFFIGYLFKLNIPIDLGVYDIQFLSTGFTFQPFPDDSGFNGSKITQIRYVTGDIFMTSAYANLTVAFLEYLKTNF